MSQQRRRPGDRFDLDDFEGFYVGSGRCIHVGFEDDNTVYIDVFDDERAAYNSEVGESICSALINITEGTAEVAHEQRCSPAGAGEGEEQDA